MHTEYTHALGMHTDRHIEYTYAKGMKTGMQTGMHTEYTCESGTCRHAHRVHMHKACMHLEYTDK